MSIKQLFHSILTVVAPLGATAVGLSMLFTSCEETEAIDEYADWEARNTAYIDSVAAVAEANADGKWMRILSYKLDSVDAEGNRAEYGKEDYIYCHVEESGTGTMHPLFTDLVSVNYRGWLIPTLTSTVGKVFDESYKGTFNPEFNKPREFYVDELIAGWSTALMHMVEGDRWLIYVPAKLGYGEKKSDDIPAYSTLIFDVNLVDISL